jgi:hypothetical protein
MVKEPGGPHDSEQAGRKAHHLIHHPHKADGVYL